MYHEEIFSALRAAFTSDVTILLYKYYDAQNTYTMYSARPSRLQMEQRHPGALEVWNSAEVFVFHVTLTSDVTNVDDVWKKIV